MDWFPEASYESQCDSFRSQLPSTTALVEQCPEGEVREHTFGSVAEPSKRFANGLRGLVLQ